MVSQSPSIAQDYIDHFQRMQAAAPMPKVSELFFPALIDNPQAHAEFGVVVLADGSVGLTYLHLEGTRREAVFEYLSELVGAPPGQVIGEFAGPSAWRKAVAMGVLNACAQSFMSRLNVALPAAGDSLGNLDLHPGDRVGMVGYFPPLVQAVKDLGIQLNVLEFKSERHCVEPGLRVSDDRSILAHCNKVLCTSTVVLNDTLDQVLEACCDADRIAVIGPSAGFLPDPLFARGVSSVGGCHIPDAKEFLSRCRENKRWGGATIKYCLHKANYPGLDNLLENAKTLNISEP